MTKNRIKLVKEALIKEGYGSGFSFTGGSIRGMGGGTRSGWGSGSNLGGPNMMYTYEIKPLNHTLEPKPTVTSNQVEQLHVGSKVKGKLIKSNAVQYDKEITGILQRMVTTDDGAIKYYVVFDSDTATSVKIDPTTIKLVIEEPVKYFADATSDTPSERRRKMERAARTRKLVSESFSDFLEKHTPKNKNNYKI